MNLSLVFLVFFASCAKCFQPFFPSGRIPGGSKPVSKNVDTNPVAQSASPESLGSRLRASVVFPPKLPIEPEGRDHHAGLIAPTSGSSVHLKDVNFLQSRGLQKILRSQKSNKLDTSLQASVPSNPLVAAHTYEDIARRIVTLEDLIKKNIEQTVSDKHLHLTHKAMETVVKSKISKAQRPTVNAHVPNFLSRRPAPAIKVDSDLHSFATSKRANVIQAKSTSSAENGGESQRQEESIVQGFKVENDHANTVVFLDLQSLKHLDADNSKLYLKKRNKSLKKIEGLQVASIPGRSQDEDRQVGKSNVYGVDSVTESYSGRLNGIRPQVINVFDKDKADQGKSSLGVQPIVKSASFKSTFFGRGK